jgi:hypothetical protein
VIHQRREQVFFASQGFGELVAFFELLTNDFSLGFDLTAQGGPPASDAVAISISPPANAKVCRELHQGGLARSWISSARFKSR